ncbi:MAG: hypothetical protein ABIL25_08310 [candidate division WOR-3 bacterium]
MVWNLRVLFPALLLLSTGITLGWWDTWPYLEHQDMLGRSIEICAVRYPEMASEIQAFRDEMLSGTHDEDYDEDEVNGSYCDYSGYCVAVPGAWWPTARRHLNAIQWVHDTQNPNNWAAAVAAYNFNRADAYYMLGHIIHNLQDLFVPAHAHISPHGAGTSGLVENHSWPLYFDNFEQYCEVTSNELNRARPDRIPEAMLDTLMVRAAAFAATDVESVGFKPSQYYAPPDAPGGWGRYRPYPSGGYPCGNDRISNSLANSWSLWIVPACCEYAAAAIRTFWLECRGVGQTDAPLARILPTSPRSPVRTGSVLVESSRPVVVRFFSPDGRLGASVSGTSIRCPELAPGPWFVRVLLGTDSATFALSVIR